MVKRILFLAGIFLAVVCLKTSAYSQTEQPEIVNGHYDSQNDWFVFEWDRQIFQGIEKASTIYDPPHKIKPIVKAKADYDKNTGKYTFNYEVTNQKGAKQPLYLFQVEVGSKVYDVKQPSDEWLALLYYGGGLFEWSLSGGIPSGETVKGFSFKSKGLPTIVGAGFFGYQRSEFAPPIGDFDTDEAGDSYERVMKRLEEQYPEKFKSNPGGYTRSP